TTTGRPSGSGAPGSSRRWSARRSRGSRRPARARTKGAHMAATHVALLRGINVGTAKRVAMADLRQLMTGLGYSDVRTLLNSGNVVFTAPPRGGDPCK